MTRPNSNKKNTKSQKNHHGHNTYVNYNKVNTNTTVRGRGNISRKSNIDMRSTTRTSGMPAAGAMVYPGARASSGYAGRIRDNGVRRDNRKNQKFYNTRRVIVSGKELTTPIHRKRKQAVSQTRADVKIRVKTIDIAKKTFPVSAIFYVLIVTGVFMCLIFSQMVLNECIVNISQAQERIQVARDKEALLTRQLEARDDLIAFEKIAVEELGMIKEDMLLKKYISLKHEDTVEIMKGNEGILTQITNIIPQIFLAPNESDE